MRAREEAVCVCVPYGAPQFGWDCLFNRVLIQNRSWLVGVFTGGSQ